MKTLLANLFVYRQNIQTVHWKMHGTDFIDVHKFTDVMYEDINEFADRIVEKYIQKNKIIDTTLTTQLKLADIKELDVEKLTVVDGIKKLLEDGKHILKLAESEQDNLEDLGTMYLVIDDLKEYLEKTIWLLSKQIQK